MALYFVPYPLTQSNILSACLTIFRSVSTYILMFFQINCRQFELAIFTGNHSLWALFTFMKIPTFTFYCFFAKSAIHRCMVFIIMFIHKLPWNHFSTVLALLEVTGTVYRMQVDVGRWDLTLTVRAGGDGGDSRGGIGVGAGRCHVAPLTSGSRSDRQRGAVSSAAAETAPGRAGAAGDEERRAAGGPEGRRGEPGRRERRRGGGRWRD